MTKFVVEVGLLYHCAIEAETKEQAQEIVWDKSSRDLGFLVDWAEDDLTVVSVRAEKSWRNDR
jgi:hypothetical protein